MNKEQKTFKKFEAATRGVLWGVISVIFEIFILAVLILLILDWKGVL